MGYFMILERGESEKFLKIHDIATHIIGFVRIPMKVQRSIFLENSESRHLFTWEKSWREGGREGKEGGRGAREGGKEGGREGGRKGRREEQREKREVKDAF